MFYLFLRERARAGKGQTEGRERETEGEKEGDRGSEVGSGLTALSLMRGSNSPTVKS